jgi:hypothetical protein
MELHTNPQIEGIKANIPGRKYRPEVFSSIWAGMSQLKPILLASVNGYYPLSPRQAYYFHSFPRRRLKKGEGLN